MYPEYVGESVYIFQQNCVINLTIPWYNVANLLQEHNKQSQSYPQAVIKNLTSFQKLITRDVWYMQCHD